MPLARLLFPVWVDEGLDSHKAFIVRYATGEDVDLSYHFDNAEVTLNVNLGKQFNGGNLYFGKMKNVRVMGAIYYTVYTYVYPLFDGENIYFVRSVHNSYAYYWRVLKGNF